MSSISTTHAGRYAGPGVIAVQEVEIAEPGGGEVLIEVASSGICGSDLHAYAGRWPQNEVTPGHEISGSILQVGDGVHGFAPGDLVCVEPTIGCRVCRYCREGEVNLCDSLQFLSVHQDGGMAGLLLAPAACLHKLPGGMSTTLGALIEPLAVGVHASRKAGVKSDQVVVVVGSGTIGLMAAIAALEDGARAVIVAAKHPHQLEAAERLGAHGAVPENLDQAVKDATDGQGADVVIETVGGAGQAVSQAMTAARKGGTVALVGGFTRPASMHLARVVHREVSLVGCSCYSRDRSPTDFERALQIALSNESRLKSLVTHRFPLSAISDGFKTAADKATGAIKVQLEPGG